jgi:DnaK suppressor protein
METRALMEATGELDSERLVSTQASVGAHARTLGQPAGGTWRAALSGPALQRLRRRLDERERELRTKIVDERNRVQDEAAAQLDGGGGDIVDRAFVTTQLSIERDLIERCMGQLDEIARTHDRIATGDIGICVDCTDPIEGERLDANPVASRCTECQMLREKAARINAR